MWRQFWLGKSSQYLSNFKVPINADLFQWVWDGSKNAFLISIQVLRHLLAHGKPCAVFIDQLQGYPVLLAGIWTAGVPHPTFTSVYLYSRDSYWPNSKLPPLSSWAGWQTLLSLLCSQLGAAMLFGSASWHKCHLTTQLVYNCHLWASSLFPIHSISGNKDQNHVGEVTYISTRWMRLNPSVGLSRLWCKEVLIMWRLSFQSLFY